MALTQTTSGGVKDDAITLAHLAAGTDGQIITYDASGNPVAVGPGTDGQVLTSTGAGSPPAFESISIPAGTTINNNANNRIITGSDTANTLEGESNLTWDGNDLSLSGTAPAINFTDTDSDDYKIHNVQGVLKITDTTASADRFVINDNGTGYFQSNFQIGSTTTSPGATLHVKSSYPSLKIDDGDNGTNAYIGIIAGTGKESNLNFGDPADDDHSQISYDHNGDHMKFKIGGTEKFRVNSNGICIGGTGSANALDDYEEGTFTPDWRGASALGTTSYGTYNVGSYIKIGNQVTVRGYSEITGSSGGSGMWFINNLPFVVKNGHGYRSVGSVLLENFNLDSDILDIVCYANPNVNDMHLRGNRDDANYSGNIRANSDTDFEVAWTITYQVA